MRLGRIDLSFGVGAALALTYVAILVGLVIAGRPAVVSVSGFPSGSFLFPRASVDALAGSGSARPRIEVIDIEPAAAEPAGSGGGTYVTVRPVQVAPPRSPADPGDEAPRAGTAPGLVGAATAGGLLFLGLASVAWMPNLAGFLVLMSLSVATLVFFPLVDSPLNGALLVPAPLAAAFYASDPRRRLHRAARSIASVALLAVLAGWAIANAAFISDRHIPVAIAVLGAVMLGALGVFSAWNVALKRAQARRTATGGTAPLARLLADELVPGRSVTRLSAIESERARLATELHAGVLPDLSAVIREIEAGAPPDEAAARLREVATELRDLMSERRLAVLEEGGLVRALEWLAEHVEARSGVTVDLDVSGTSGDSSRGRPPHDVELTVYRIAQQAIDNALLHARPGRVGVRVTVDDIRADVEVSDDGTGIAPDAEVRALNSGHLGISDMRQRAASIGAAFTIGPAPGGGTLVKVRWPA